MSFAELDALAAQAPAGSDGLLVVPHLAGAGTPLWRSDAAGQVLGVRLSHGRSHLARAVLEGVAYAQRHALMALQECVARIDGLRFTGGGAASTLWSQILADVTGLPVTVPESPAIDRPGCGAGRGGGCRGLCRSPRRDRSGARAGAAFHAGCGAPSGVRCGVPILSAGGGGRRMNDVQRIADDMALYSDLLVQSGLLHLKGGNSSVRVGRGTGHHAHAQLQERPGAGTAHPGGGRLGRSRGARLQRPVHAPRDLSQDRRTGDHPCPSASPRPAVLLRRRVQPDRRERPDLPGQEGQGGRRPPLHGVECRGRADGRRAHRVSGRDPQVAWRLRDR